MKEIELYFYKVIYSAILIGLPLYLETCKNFELYNLGQKKNF